MGHKSQDAETAKKYAKKFVRYKEGLKNTVLD